MEDIVENKHWHCWCVSSTIGREYGFQKCHLERGPRTTDLNLFTTEPLSGFPTNNTEKKLAEFIERAPVFRYISKKFTVKGIGNDCFLLLPDSFRKDTGRRYNIVVTVLIDK